MRCKVTNAIETFPGSSCTNGFMLKDNPEVVTDPRGFQRIDLKRNHTTVLQMSIYLLTSWRANVDIQLLLYENSPDQADAKDIAKVTDYIVGYISKCQNEIICHKNYVAELGNAFEPSKDCICMQDLQVFWAFSFLLSGVSLCKNRSPQIF